VQLLDLGAHLDPELRRPGWKRLIEQEALRVAHDRAAHRDALPLAAGERLRFALQSASIPRIFAARATLWSIAAFSTPRSLSPNAMFSYTLMCG
jgi:hypothetical protein